MASAQRARALLPAALLCVAFGTAHAASQCEMGSVRGAAGYEKAIEAREGGNWNLRSLWKDDPDGHCVCLEPASFLSVQTWGKVRKVRLNNYIPARMHLWVKDDEEDARFAMDGGDEESWQETIFKLINQIPSVSSYGSASCSLMRSGATECVVIRSPFQRTCVGVKAVLQNDATLTVRDEYDRWWTLQPLLIALVLFVAAPAVAHSLWGYYMTGMLASSILCIAIIVLFAGRKAMGGWKRFVAFGLASWLGWLQMSVLQNMLNNKWCFLGVAIFALLGFLFVHYYPPEDRHRTSLEIIIRFGSFVFGLFTVPSFSREGVAWCICIGICVLAELLLRRGGFLAPGARGNAVGGDGPGAGGGGEGRSRTAQGMGGRGRSPRGIRAESPDAEGSSAAYAYSTPARAQPKPKKRLSEKRQIELNYRGPLQVDEDNNPFHTRGAPEYISEREYETQSDAFTRQALDDLAQYVSSTNYLEQNADRHTARARRGLAREIARERDYSLPENYYDE